MESGCGGWRPEPWARRAQGLGGQRGDCGISGMDGRMGGSDSTGGVSQESDGRTEPEHVQSSNRTSAEAGSASHAKS